MNFDAFETLSTGIAFLNSRGSIYWANASLKQILKNTELNGIQFSSFLQEQSVDILLTKFAELTQSKNGFFENVWAIIIGGKTHWLRAHVNYFEQKDLDIFFMVEVQDLSDLFDEKQKIEREKDLAVEATNSKSVFLANMSHEIRTPIHTIHGMTELLIDTELDDEQKEYITQIKYANEVLLSLINDILDLSKIEAGKFHIEKLPLNLLESIESAADMQALSAFKKGLELILDIDPALPTHVIGDAVRLRQIFTNLIANAIKFTSRGQIRIRCKLKGNTETGILFYGEVADTGIGIPSDKLNSLFQAFTQVDTSTTRKYGGTGLGLNICSILAKLMGGTVGVRSIEGRGSVFYFSLPFDLSEEKLDETNLSRTILADKRILIVDDNADTRRSLRKTIEAFGGTVFEAEDGAMALIILKSAAQTKKEFDLAIIDLEMGAMDGWRFASEVNSDKEINKLKMIMASPPGMAQDAKMKLLNWMDGYIDKPFKRLELIGMISETINQSIDLSLSDEQVDNQEIVSPIPYNLFNPAQKPLSEETQSSEPIMHEGLILVAEDHFVNQKLFSTILNRLGYMNILASDGLEAYEKALESQAQLVFMDVQMPNLNGYEATIKLRRSGFKNPIIAVTANAIKGDIEKCLQAGMDDYVSKPFTKKDIEAMILKWLGKKSTIEASMDNDEPIFNYDQALEVFMQDQEILTQVITQYIDDMAGQLSNLRSLIQEKNTKEARIIAHTLKGSSLNLGIVRFGKCAEIIEDSIKAENFEAIESHLENLEANWSLFLKEYSSK